MNSRLIVDIQMKTFHQRSIHNFSTMHLVDTGSKAIPIKKHHREPHSNMGLFIDDSIACIPRHILDKMDFFDLRALCKEFNPLLTSRNEMTEYLCMIPISALSDAANTIIFKNI